MGTTTSVDADAPDVFRQACFRPPGTSNTSPAPSVVQRFSDRPRHLSIEQIKGLTFGVAVDRHNHTRWKSASSQAIFVVIVRQGCEELNAGAEQVKKLTGVCFGRRRFEARD
jgi:hypothetical protein